jgi:hypothetical protein
LKIKIIERYDYIMSESSRKSMEGTKESLKQAEQHLQKASDGAKSGGDKTLHQRIEKVRTDTQQMHQEIEKKLGTKEG